MNKKGIGQFPLFMAMLSFSIVAGYPFWSSGKVGVKDGIKGKYAIELKDKDGNPVKYAADINSSRPSNMP